MQIPPAQNGKSPVRKADFTANPTGLSLCQKPVHSTYMGSIFYNETDKLSNRTFRVNYNYSEVRKNERTNNNKRNSESI